MSTNTAPSECAEPRTKYNMPASAEWDRLVDTAPRGYKCSNGKHHTSGLVVFNAMLNRGLFKGATPRSDDGRHTILDYGCGNGRLSYHFAGVGMHLVGMDVIAESVAFCREHLPGTFLHLPVGNPHYAPQQPVHPLNLQLPFEDSSFDVVVAHSVFTHLGNIAAAAALNVELWRVLRPGGRAWFTFFTAPPNEVSTDCARTVFSEESLQGVILAPERWRVVHREGGTTSAKHDQCCFVLEKISQP